MISRIQSDSPRFLILKHASSTIIYCRSALKTHLFRKVPDMSCSPADTLQRQNVNSIRFTDTIRELQTSLCFSVHRVSRRKLEKHMRGFIQTQCRPLQHVMTMWWQKKFIYNMMTNPEDGNSRIIKSFTVFCACTSI